MNVNYQIHVGVGALEKKKTKRFDLLYYIINAHIFKLKCHNFLVIK